MSESDIDDGEIDEWDPPLTKRILRLARPLSDLLQFDHRPRIAHIEDVPALDYRSFEGRVGAWQLAGV